jgi:Domain of unknown function (DUF4326)
MPHNTVPQHAKPALAQAAPRVLNRRTDSIPQGAIYVGRPTRFGNPFVVGKHGSQGECVDLYRAWLMAPERAELRARAARELRGRDLVCWCHPKRCHADVLLEIVNA